MPRSLRGKATAKIVRAARDQRRQPTTAEDRLWSALRGRRLSGLKFRRQHPYGQFILDLFCVEHRLSIEIDGGVHASPMQVERDVARTELLKAHGIRILRFGNEEVCNDLPGVLRRILEAVHAPLS